MENQPEEKQKIFSFKEYYQSNPTFKQNHIEKGKTKVPCSCGKLVPKWHLSRHQQSKTHKQNSNLNLFFNIKN